MVTIGQTAKDYESTQMKNIADLEAVSTNQQIFNETRTDKEHKEYRVMFIVIDGEEYRVPRSVLEQLQTALESRPNLKTFKVTKKGEGLNSKYTVIALE